MINLKEHFTDKEIHNMDMISYRMNLASKVIKKGLGKYLPKEYYEIWKHSDTINDVQASMLMGLLKQRDYCKHNWKKFSGSCYRMFKAENDKEMPTHHCNKCGVMAIIKQDDLGGRCE